MGGKVVVQFLLQLAESGCLFGGCQQRVATFGQCVPLRAITVPARFGMMMVTMIVVVAVTMMMGMVVMIVLLSLGRGRAAILGPGPGAAEDRKRKQHDS